MCNHTLASLVGRSIRGSIGEPWDFESDAGPNAITGIAETTSSDVAEPQWILCRIEPFMHLGHQIVYVVAVSRYRKSEPLTALGNGKRIGVNLVFDPSGTPMDESRVSNLLAVANSPFLVGTIEITN